MNFFEALHALPHGWKTQGPFGIWNHPDGSEVVCIEPGYILSLPNGAVLQFDNFEDALNFDREPI